MTNRLRAEYRKSGPFRLFSHPPSRFFETLLVMAPVAYQIN